MLKAIPACSAFSFSLVEKMAALKQPCFITLSVKMLKLGTSNQGADASNVDQLRVVSIDKEKIDEDKKKLTRQCDSWPAARSQAVKRLCIAETLRGKFPVDCCG